MPSSTSPGESHETVRRDANLPAAPGNLAHPPDGDAQAWLAAIVDSAVDAIISKNLDGTIISWNSGAERTFGYTAVEAVGRPAASLLIPADRQDEELAILQRLSRGERVEHYETVRLRKDGSRVEVTSMISPVRDAAGRIAGAAEVVREITDRRRAEELTRRLAAIVESSEDAIISKNLDGIIQSWNLGAERIFGYAAAEAIGRPILMLIPTERHAEEPVILQRLRAGERIDHYDTVRQRKDGTLIEVSLTVSPIFDATGRVIGASKIARDVTERKRVQRELEEAHQKALAANQAKDDFLAALSHELRTPLNPVLLTASEAAADTTLPARVRDQFEAIRKNIELEARLIDDLLDLARITRGKLPLDTAAHDLHAILRDAMDTIRPDAKAKKLELTGSFASTPLVVSGDAVRLQQVLWNVLKNAVKFTPEGGCIRVATRRNPARKCVVVEISDTGVGLAKDELERIFDAFAQGQAAQAHRFGGLGLGLTISKLITELHRGSIHAESEGRGRGATFIIELPLAETALERPPENPAMERGASLADAGRTRRILLVEDHEASRSALAQLLRRRGFEVRPAVDLAEARERAAEEHFDLAFCDIGLPDGDGVELMAELLRRHGLRSIALTGFGMEEDIKRSREAGALAHLTKPISVQALDRTVATALTAGG